jgi:hypothetical protein
MAGEQRPAAGFRSSRGAPRPLLCSPLPSLLFPPSRRGSLSLMSVMPAEVMADGGATSAWWSHNKLRSVPFARYARNRAAAGVCPDFRALVLPISEPTSFGLRSGAVPSGTERFVCRYGCNSILRKNQLTRHKNKGMPIVILGGYRIFRISRAACFGWMDPWRIGLEHARKGGGWMGSVGRLGMYFVLFCPIVPALHCTWCGRGEYSIHESSMHGDGQWHGSVG